MKKHTAFSATVMFAIGMAVVPLSAVAEAPAGEGWVSLFNGKDLAGWKVPEVAPGIWTIIDGVIDCNPRADIKGDKSLWSEKSFKDFVLHVEWRLKETKGEYGMPTILPDGSYKLGDDGKPILKLTPNADSGIYVRGSSKSQINIWCWPCGSGEIWGYRTDSKMPPEIRAGATPKVRADKPVGKWNTFVITMKGDRITVELNGKTVLDQARLPGVPESGPIALQHHGGYHPGRGSWGPASSLIQFRNIYVKELDVRK